MIESLLFAMLAGFSIAAPLGMNGIICIKFSLEKGFLAGFVSGLGESTAVGFYSWLIISSAIVGEFLLSKYRLIFHILSGVILVLMGIQCFLSHKKLKQPQLKKKYLVMQNSFARFLSIYFLGLSIALINPMTIVPVFAFISSRFYLSNHFLSFPTVLGFFFGTAVWWLILSFSISYLRKMNERFLFIFVNYFSGTFLILFGLRSIFNKLH